MFPTGLPDGEIMFENPPERYLIFHRVPISSWGSRGFSILIYPSDGRLENVPVDL